MSQEITTAMIKTYEALVAHLLQQRRSVLRDTVTVDSGVRGYEKFYDQLGESVALKRMARHADSEYANTPHSRRKVSLFDYDVEDLVDPLDVLKVAISPEGAYAQSQAWAMGRAIDDAVIAAARGTAMTGANGTTSTVLPSAQKVGVGTTNMSKAKVLAAKEKLDAAEVPEQGRFMIHGSNQLAAMLAVSEAVSGDYVAVKALIEGTLKYWCGFTWVRSERLVKVGDDRFCLAYWKPGVKLAIQAEPTADILVVPSKQGNPVKVSYKMAIGSTRMQEEAVVEIACDETK